MKQVIGMAKIFKTIQFCFSVIDVWRWGMDSAMESGFWNVCTHLFASHLSLLPSPPLFFPAYSTFYIVGLILSMQIPFVGFQPIRTSEHMAAAGKKTQCLLLNSQTLADLFPCVRKNLVLTNQIVKEKKVLFSICREVYFPINTLSFFVWANGGKMLP